MISPEKTKSCEIVLGKLKLPDALICDSLMRVDLKVLTPSCLESLDGILPTDEEIKELNRFTGDRA